MYASKIMGVSRRWLMLAGASKVASKMSERHYERTFVEAFFNPKHAEYLTTLAPNEAALKGVLPLTIDAGIRIPRELDTEDEQSPEEPSGPQQVVRDAMGKLSSGV